MAIFFNKNKSLYLYDDKTGKLLTSIEFTTEEKIFSIEFIHSVNKSPVKDFYKIDENNNIIAYKTIYSTYGAGVQTELNENETITYTDDGDFVIENINKKISPLIYVVGTVHDHILTINNKEIILNKEFGINKHIRFEVK